MNQGDGYLHLVDSCAMVMIFHDVGCYKVTITHGDQPIANSDITFIVLRGKDTVIISNQLISLFTSLLSANRVVTGMVGLKLISNTIFSSFICFGFCICCWLTQPIGNIFTSLCLPCFCKQLRDLPLKCTKKKKRHMKLIVRLNNYGFIQKVLK